LTGFSRVTLDEEVFANMLSPSVEKAIKRFFPQKERNDLDKRAVADILVEEQERAI
jgi:NADPH-dependent ferric siderophore reductase